uniref:Uncharacterized protein n=1 Tax=Cacopsylla melanoneura TaxID=428564 RepID=A0A8D8X0F0_9HEMI
MELARLPLDKKEQAERQIQDNIERKIKALEEDNSTEKDLHRKLPLLKQMLENMLATPPCLTSESDEVSKPSDETKEEEEDGAAGKEPNNEDLEYLISDKHNEELLAKVKQYERDIRAMPQSWVEILAKYDQLRTWQNPWKPFLDVERWRQLLKQFHLKEKPPSEVEEEKDAEEEVAPSLTSVVSPYGEFENEGDGEEGYGDYISQPSTVFDGETSEVVIGRSTPEALSLLTFKEDPRDYTVPCPPNLLVKAKKDDENVESAAEPDDPLAL